MAIKSEELLSAVAGLAAALVVGIGALVAGFGADEDPARAVLWWAAYLVYLAVFVFDAGFLRSRLPWPFAVTVVVLFVTESVVWFAAPGLSSSALLFVITTAVASFGLGPRTVAVLVVVQSILIAVGGASAGWSLAEVVISTLAYLTFQVFAALVIAGARREAAARAELAAAHADLRAATALLATSSRDAERLRIARDLHDVIGHQLTALALELEVASHRTAGEGREHVVRARGIAKDLLADVRSTVGELRDARTRLEPTLRAVLERIPGLEVDLTVNERTPLDEAQTIAVVRSVQEIATNTVRHAHATRLEVTVVCDDDGLNVHASDNGVGVRHLERGNGLTGMGERIEELGGELLLESAPGHGFSVTARVPAR
ncbi:sensor histidine kinase [Agromyces laixinhei]|uniref:sensor histidine kinase n=1 Tax=Agromyces laixinhei TaxID=2585717 RepID=UPI001115FBF0|nr:sensor histidine kinase [Agromyces laixinhei]